MFFLLYMFFSETFFCRIDFFWEAGDVILRWFFWRICFYFRNVFSWPYNRN
jgi:hypothetical protein